MGRVCLIEKNKCTGCSACASVCPTHSITMVEDKEGFQQPKVDNKTCIGCHKCEKTCPILNKEPERAGETKAYAAINKDDSVRSKSSSGGVFHALSSYVVEQGGVVFGARFDDRWEVMHDYSETLEGIKPFMGSKYVQSRIGDSYSQAKRFLEDGRLVLFSGTPCQLGGLRAFLEKEHERLIQVDLVCHGVPSPKVWRSYLKDYVDGEIVTVSFRDKKEGWKGVQNVTITTDTSVISEKQRANPFYRGFLRNVYLRISCYNCQFRTYHRNSDITIADYWGVDKLCPEMFDNKGTSVVFTHTEKGERCLEALTDSVLILPQSRENAVKHNPIMDREDPKAINRKRFFHVFQRSSFKGAEFVIDKDAYVTRIVRKVRNAFFKSLRVK